MAKSKEPTRIDIAVYVLVRLQSDAPKVSTEAVAAKCAELVPDRFAWVLPEFRERGYADLEIVRRALRGAARRRKPLVKGKPSRDPDADGWNVLEEGVAWYEANAKHIEASISQEFSVQQAEAADREIMRERMASEPLFKLFIDQGSLEDVEAKDLTRMLGVSLQSPHESIERAFDKLSIQAELAKDNEVITFVRACRKKFSDIL